MKTKFVILVISFTLIIILSSILLVRYSINLQIEESQKATSDDAKTSEINFDCP